MAERSDLVGEVAQLAAVADIGREGPTNHVTRDAVRRDRQKAHRMEAVQLRLAGLTYEQIADRLDMSKEGARQLVTRTLESAANRSAEEMRAEENARLDRLQGAIWGAALGGDLKAVDQVLKLMDQRARLNGLNAPTRIMLSTTVRVEMEQALADLREIVEGEVIEDDDPGFRAGEATGDPVDDGGSGGEDR